jgi:hypothetical protein
LSSSAISFFILYCSYWALSIIKSHNIQSNKMHSIVFRYSMLQYLVNQFSPTIYTCFQLFYITISCKSINQQTYKVL